MGPKLHWLLIGNNKYTPIDLVVVDSSPGNCKSQWRLLISFGSNRYRFSGGSDWIIQATCMLSFKEKVIMKSSWQNSDFTNHDQTLDQTLREGAG